MAGTGSGGAQSERGSVRFASGTGSVQAIHVVLRVQGEESAGAVTHALIQRVNAASNLCLSYVPGEVFQLRIVSCVWREAIDLAVEAQILAQDEQQRRASERLGAGAGSVAR